VGHRHRSTLTTGADNKIAAVAIYYLLSQAACVICVLVLVCIHQLLCFCVYTVYYIPFRGNEHSTYDFLWTRSFILLFLSEVLSSFHHNNCRMRDSVFCLKLINRINIFLIIIQILCSMLIKFGVKVTPSNRSKTVFELQWISWFSGSIALWCNRANYAYASIWFWY